MEITNCEQHVLAELDYEQRRNERLVAENSKLAKQLDAMTKMANGYRQIINRPKTPIEALADRVMREEMLTRFTYAEITDVKSAFSGRLLDFDEWCHDAMQYVALADDVGEEFDFLGWHFHFWGDDTGGTPRYGATMSRDGETWECDYDCMFGAGFDDIH